jgi:2-polyprenyl-3-methyl-5-hydroxy-6-metoxy-1,4-benzoquinol methylase
MSKQAYPDLNLYSSYLKRLIDARYSASIPNVTTKITLEYMNYAINLCDTWDSCMDIGGGSGHYLNALATRFKKATLVEVEDLAEHAELTARYKNIEIVHSFIEEYHSTEKTDFILLADIFEHIPDIKPFITKVSQFQDIGGVVYIMTPNPVTCGPANESGLHHTIHLNGHIRHYPSHEIISLMEENGYKLMFKIYEEGRLRKKAKYVIYGIARRDALYSKNLFYQMIRPLVLIASWPLLFVLEKMTYSDERKNIHNEFGTITQDLAFKKIHAS